MRIFIFLLISSLVHLTVLMNLYFSFDVVPNNNKHEVLSVVFAKKNLQDTPDFGKNLNEITKLEPTRAQIEIKKKNILDIFAETKQISQVSGLEPFPPIKSKESVKNTQNDSMAIDLTNYYAGAEVDRKALAQMNVDQSMLPAEDFSGFPIKLRLYVNAFGRLVKVEPIAVLDQDILFVEKLTKLLYEIKFLPAKREGLDVDSYQDLLLSFNPLPIAGDQVDLN